MSLITFERETVKASPHWPSSPLSIIVDGFEVGFSSLISVTTVSTLGNATQLPLGGGISSVSSNGSVVRCAEVETPQKATDCEQLKHSWLGCNDQSWLSLVCESTCCRIQTEELCSCAQYSLRKKENLLEQKKWQISAVCRVGKSSSPGFEKNSQCACQLLSACSSVHTAKPKSCNDCNAVAFSKKWIS